jgi:hypothetical protein
VAELGSAGLLEVLGKKQETNLGGAYAYVKGYAESAKKSAVSGCTTVLVWRGLGALEVLNHRLGNCWV